MDWHVSPEQYAGNLATNSAVRLLGEDARRRRLDEVIAVVRGLVEVAGTATVPVHHEVFCLHWDPLLRVGAGPLVHHGMQTNRRLPR